jgi:transketolase
MDKFSRSGRPHEIYEHFGFDPAGLREKVLRSLK